MQKILITGGAGFIGSHTAVELVAAGYEPVIIDNFTNSEPEVIKNLENLLKQPVVSYRHDFQDTGKTSRVIKEHNITGIIHFAAFKAVGESVAKPLAYYQNNVGGLVALLELAQKHKIKNFVFSSSCTVYGVPDNLPVTEDSPVKPPASPYGATKQMGEQILSDYTHSSNVMNTLSLRYFNPIGAHPSGLIGELPKGVPNNLVPFVTQTAAGIRDKLTVFGNDYDTSDGSCIRDYIHVVDLARAHVAALQCLESKQPAYYDTCNIGTGAGHSVLEVIKTFERVTGQKLKYEIGPRRDGDVPAVYADASKARQLLGWEASHTLEDALKDAWNWQQQLA